MYLAAPACPNCGGDVTPDASGGTPPHWHCEACDLIVLDTPATATAVGRPGTNTTESQP